MCPMEVSRESSVEFDVVFLCLKFARAIELNIR